MNFNEIEWVPKELSGPEEINQAKTAESFYNPTFNKYKKEVAEEMANKVEDMEGLQRAKGMFEMLMLIDKWFQQQKVISEGEDSKPEEEASMFE